MPIVLLLQLWSVAHGAAAFKTSTVPFSKGFSPLFGSGFQSSDLYNHGFFSAKIKLPSDYTAGIVVAFYTTNGDIFRKTHDELDFEFLGNIKGKHGDFRQICMEMEAQAEEEKRDIIYGLTLLKSSTVTAYFGPPRILRKNDAMGADFPSKPMRLYATIWDASDWATSGGKYRANYQYAPFVAEFTDLVLHGCATDTLEEVVATGCAQRDGQLASADFATITPKQKLAMKKFRSKYMYYSYCYDTLRYPVPPPECVIDPVVRGRFLRTRDGRSLTRNTITGGLRKEVMLWVLRNMEIKRMCEIDIFIYTIVM
ncbi:hypothetical protein DH2020_025789 [Rehmannia glutinosa]|uniref:Xyloglucan endotransglucosylase/hydrolase n=1 Tax=Rehmannia glutinosa TaxID=99300 RepID=A0ABR0W1G8_REHGL